MEGLPDEPILWDLMNKSTDLIKSLKHGSKVEPFLEIARDIERSADDYVSRRKSHHALNEHIKRIQSRMDVNKELLETAVNNVSTIRSKLGAGTETLRAFKMENLKDVNKNNIDAKLNEVHKKIQAAMKDIRSKSKGSTRLEKMLQEYNETMRETTELFRRVPQILRGEEVPEKETDGRPGTREDWDEGRARDLLKNMSALRLARAEEQESPRPVVDPAAPPAWLEFEGFDTMEELERFKEMYRRMTGEDPDAEPDGVTSDGSIEEDDLKFLEDVFKECIGQSEMETIEQKR